MCRFPTSGNTTQRGTAQAEDGARQDAAQALTLIIHSQNTVYQPFGRNQLSFCEKKQEKIIAVLKKYLPLQRFNKQMIVLQI